MNLEPCCDWCSKPFGEAKSVHPREGREGVWLCEKCEAKRVEPHTFDPNNSQPKDGGRSPVSNGEIAARAAVAICDYVGVCNPEDHDISDLIADLGHFCDREGHDFRSLVRSALNHWEAER